MDVWNVLILALVQGLCELLPVSSSAHVIMVEKLLGLDPTAPEMTMLLVMLVMLVMLHSRPCKTSAARMNAQFFVQTRCTDSLENRCLRS